MMSKLKITKMCFGQTHTEEKASYNHGSKNADTWGWVVRRGCGAGLRGGDRKRPKNLSETEKSALQPNLRVGDESEHTEVWVKC